MAHVNNSERERVAATASSHPKGNHYTLLTIAQSRRGTGKQKEKPSKDGLAVVKAEDVVEAATKVSQGRGDLRVALTRSNFHFPAADGRSG